MTNWLKSINGRRLLSPTDFAKEAKVARCEVYKDIKSGVLRVVPFVSKKMLMAWQLRYYPLGRSEKASDR